MITLIIKSSQIEDRMDAEYYKPQYLLGEKLILNKKWEYLANLAESIQYGTTPEEGFFVEEGVPFVRSQNFSLGEFRYDDLVKCTPEFHQSHQRSKILPKDILIAAVGATIGEVGIVPDDIKEGNINQNIARVRLKNKNLAYFITFFLGSKFGKNQLFRYTTRTAQGYLNTDQIKSIKVHIPPQSFQQKIEKVVRKAQEKRKSADEKYKEAEGLLEKELGVEDLDLSTEKTSEINFSKAEDRFDSKYYQLKYREIISKIKSQKSKLLGEIVKIRKGIEVGHEAYTSEGIPFIRVQDYNEKEITISPNMNFIRPYLYEELRKNHKPEPKEIIFSKDGTVGRAVVVPEEVHKFIVSGGILILTPKDIDNYYLALVLNSPTVRLQATRESIGAVIQHLSIDKVKKLKIPILSKSIQQKISSVIQESFKLRKEAKKLIKKTKKQVEEMVERS